SAMTSSVPLAAQVAVVEAEVVTDLVDHGATHLAANAVGGAAGAHQRPLEDGDLVGQVIAVAEAAAIDRNALIEAEEAGGAWVEAHAAQQFGARLVLDDHLDVLQVTRELVRNLVERLLHEKLELLAIHVRSIYERRECGQPRTA